MFVYIDGVYQCNRNISNLKFSETPGDITQETATVEFRVRQREERLPNGEWIGRPWRFEPLNIGKFLALPPGMYKQERA